MFAFYTWLQNRLLRVRGWGTLLRMLQWRDGLGCAAGTLMLNPLWMVHDVWPKVPLSTLKVGHLESVSNFWPIVDLALFFIEFAVNSLRVLGVESPIIVDVRPSSAICGPVKLIHTHATHAKVSYPCTRFFLIEFFCPDLIQFFSFLYIFQKSFGFILVLQFRWL